MAAKLIIRSPLTEESHWIEFPVVCVGSGEDCDICLDGIDIDEHALTIEYRNQRYFVHNRSSQAVYVEGRTLAGGSSHPFDPNQELQLDGDVTIELKTEGDAAPAPAPDGEPRWSNSGDVDYDAIDEGIEASASDNLEENEDQDAIDAPPRYDVKTIAQVAVIVFCFIAGAGALLSMNRRPGSSANSEVLSLQQLRDLTSSTAEPESDTDWKDKVWRELQRAERVRLRGQLVEAKDRFFRLRDEVDRTQARNKSLDSRPTVAPPVSASQSADTIAVDFTSQVASFIKDRLQLISDQE